MSIARLQSLLGDPEMRKPATKSTLVTVTSGVRVVRESPTELAHVARCSLETYSRARVIAAEGYGGDPIGKAAAAVIIGQTLDNEVRRRSSVSSVTELVTNSVFADADGKYGEQRGRYVATTRDPSRWDVEVARAIEEGDVPDLAQGAVHFLDPQLYVNGIQAGRPLGKFAERMDAWIRDEGNELCPLVPTVDPFYLLALRPGGTRASRETDYQRAIGFFTRGAAGDHAPTPGDPDVTTPLTTMLMVVGVSAALGWLALHWS